MGRPDNFELRRHLADVLSGEIDSLVDRINERGRHLEGYGYAPPEVRRPEVDALVRQLIKLWRDDVPLDDPVFEPAKEVARRRARQGVPLPSLLRAVQLAEEELWMVASTAAIGPSADAAVRAFTMWLLQLARDTMSAMAAAYAETAEAPAGDEQGRQRLWDDLLSGAVTAENISARGRAIGLHVGATYVALRARGDPLDLGAFALVMSHADDDPVGVVRDASLIPVTSAVVGVSAAASLTDLAAGFADANHAFEVASAFGIPGVHSLDSLGLRVLVFHEPAVGERLIRRYLEPLSAAGRHAGAIEESLRAYFSHGRRIENAARATGIAYNTVRNRLRRFEELANADLERTEAALEIWWAMEARKLATARAAVGPLPGSL